MSAWIDTRTTTPADTEAAERYHAPHISLRDDWEADDLPPMPVGDIDQDTPIARAWFALTGEPL